MAQAAIIGFGEVGGIFAADLREGGWDVAVFDVLGAARDRAAAAGFAVAGSAAEAARGAALVFVSVTAGSVLEAVRGLEGGLAHGPLVVDVNSVSPAVKAEAGRLVEAMGGRYVEAAVMASVPPKRIRSPMLLGGPHAEAFIEAMTPFGPDLKIYAAEIGKASAVKMCRSVMVKGIEALATESMLAARHYGVEADVLASLKDTLPHPDWPALARYVISRALIHGKRRAEEMREVARTVDEAGLEPLVSRAVAERQDWAAVQGRRMGKDALATTELTTLLDTLAATMPEAKQAAE